MSRKDKAATTKPTFIIRKNDIKAVLANPRAYRGDENQSQFWSQFGVTQSAGSRYENGRRIPTPLKVLLGLHAVGLGDVSRDVLTIVEAPVK